MGKWYGCVDNRLAEMSKQPKAVIGMGVTEMFYTDREPYEIIAIKDDRHITIRRLDYKRIGEVKPSDSQAYEYFSNEKNGTKELFLTKQGQWREKNGRKLGCNSFVLGYAEHYFDYSF